MWPVFFSLTEKISVLTWLSTELHLGQIFRLTAHSHIVCIKRWFNFNKGGSPQYCLYCTSLTSSFKSFLTSCFPGNWFVPPHHIVWVWVLIFDNVTLLFSHSFLCTEKVSDVGTLELWLGGREWFPCFPKKLESSGHPYSSIWIVEAKGNRDAIVTMTTCVESLLRVGSAWQALCFASWVHFMHEGPEAESHGNLPKVEQKLVDLGYQPKDSDSRVYTKPLCSTTFHPFWVWVWSVSASFFIISLGPCP